MSESQNFVVLKNVVTAAGTKEGVGATVYRCIGTRTLDTLDPFLLLDEFHVSPPAGFPDHPHRGFETVTYMLGGSFKHQDSNGNSGVIDVGDVQWMTAGRGIIHSEMPNGPGDNFGLQLWVNLAAKDKMTKPNYQDLTHDKLPKKILDDDVKLVVIAGKSHGIESPVTLKTKVLYTDVSVPKANTVYIEEVPKGMQGFLYAYKGSLTVNKSKKLEEKQLITFQETTQESNAIHIQTNSDNVRFFVIAGVPLKEPIARYGPFVMNTQEEIQQAFIDYQTGKLTQ